MSFIILIIINQFNNLFIIKMKVNIIFLLLISIINQMHSLYCEEFNCYTLLQVSQDAQQDQITKSFRLMAKKYHPDRSRDNTTALFQAINNAYEILNNENTRKAYDEFLQNPNANSAQHYYKYYKAFYMPKTNPFLVVFIFLCLVSSLQFVMRKSMNKNAVDRILESVKIRDQINERYWEQGEELKGKSKKPQQIKKQLLKKIPNYKTKQQIKQEMRGEISISGGLSPPKITDVLIIRLILIPYTFAIWLKNWIRWIYKYYLFRHPYVRQDQQYLTMKKLKIPLSRWEGVNQIQKQQLINKKLWIKQEYLKYQEQCRIQQEQYAQQQKSTNKYKQYMRYMKKNG